MFTGIIADRGEIVKVEPAGPERRIWIRSELLEDCAIGASVAVSGVCITVVEREGDVCGFDLSAETIARSTLGGMQAGNPVNLERPLLAGQELGGHIVQGHVDGVGDVIAVHEEGGSRRVVVGVTPGITRYVIEKGSVTVDGVSLTVSEVSDDRFEVALIPHTLAVTTLGGAEPGRTVNIEVDVLAKYVEKLRDAK